MPVEANAKIVIKGGPESLKVLQGIKRESNEAAREMKKALQEQEKAQRAAAKAAEAAANAQKRAARDAARAQERAARDTSRVQQKAASDASRAQQKAQADAVRAAQKAQREIERTAQREADRWQKLAEKSRDIRIRAQEAATRSAAREAAKQVDLAKKTAEAEAKAKRDAWRKAGGLVTAGAAGLLAGAAVASRTARGIAGVKDVRERITSANEFRERLVLTTGAAGMSAQEREAVQGQVLAASTSTGKDIGELMGVLETGQAQFNNLKFFADNLQEIAKISKVAGADSGEFAKALGFIQQAFGLTGDEAMEAAYLMKAAADKGAVEAKDFARDFAASAGIFSMNTGQKGIAGVRQFLGTSQGVATGGFGSAESSTRLERFITDLNDVDVQKGLAKIGVKNIVDKSTGKIDVANVVEQLSTNAKFQKASVRQGIFKDVRGQQAIEALVAARGRVKKGVAGAVDLESISRVDAAAGRDAVTTGMKSLEGEGFFQMQQEAARMQAETVKRLKDHNEHIMMVVKASDRLEDAFGRLYLWADSIAAIGVAGALTNLVTGGGVRGLLGGGGGAGGGGGGGGVGVPTVVSAGGKGAGRLSRLAGKGLRLAGWVGLATTAYELGEMGITAGDQYVKDKTGKGVSERLFGHQSGPERDAYLTRQLLESGGGIRPASKTGTAGAEQPASQAAPGSGIIGAIGAMNRDVVRELRDMNTGLRVTSQKPPPGAPRGPR